MTNASRKQRGHDTQNAVAAWYRGNGFPHAESAGAGRPGVDVLGMPGVTVRIIEIGEGCDDAAAD